MSSTKAVSYRVQNVTAERIDKLAERFDQSRTKVVDDAIWNIALQEGVLDEEAREAIDELIADHGGEDATVTFAIQLTTGNVPVAINGKPTDRIRAAVMQRPVAYFTSVGPPNELEKEVRLLAFIPNTGIVFDLGEHEPPKTIAMPLAELHDRRQPFSPRTSFGERFNRDLRRQAGYDVDDD